MDNVILTKLIWNVGEPLNSAKFRARKGIVPIADVMPILETTTIYPPSHNFKVYGLPPDEKPKEIKHKEDITEGLIVLSLEQYFKKYGEEGTYFDGLIRYKDGWKILLSS